MRVCGAKTRNGGTCKQAALDNGRCHYHGGKSPAGIASPVYKTGRYSKYLPARLTARYAEAQQDGELLALRDEVALVDARLADLLARVDTGESGAIWSELKKAHADLVLAREAKDLKAMGEALSLIGDLITRGHTDYRAWHEVSAVLEQRRKLVESERKRLIEMQQMVTTEQAMILVHALLASVKEHVTDRAALAAIQTKFIQLTARDDQRIIDAE